MMLDTRLLQERRQIKTIGSTRVGTAVEENVGGVGVEDEVADEREDGLADLFGGA